MMKNKYFIWHAAIIFVFFGFVFIHGYNSKKISNIKHNSNNVSKTASLGKGSSNKVSNSMQEQQVFTEGSTELDNFKLIGSIEEQKLFVYGKDHEDKTKYLYSQIAVKYKDKIKQFPWTSMKKTPYMAVTDLTNDGRADIAIELKGTNGVNINNCFLHILDSDTLDEIKIENPEDIIGSQAQLEVSSNKILLKLNNKHYEVKVDSSEKDINEIYANMNIGACKLYSLDNNIISCKVSVQSYPSNWYGNIIIKYKYTSDGFIPESMEYKEIGEFTR